MSAYVLDASVLASWLLPGQSTPKAEALFDHAPILTLIAPRFFVYEAHRLMLKAERSGRFPSADIDDWLAMLWSLPLEVEAEASDGDLERVRALARAEGLSFYDALYLDVGLRRNMAVASGDMQLLRAAERRGLPIYDVRSPYD